MVTASGENEQAQLARVRNGCSLASLMTLGPSRKHSACSLPLTGAWPRGPQVFMDSCPSPPSLSAHRGQAVFLSQGEGPRCKLAWGEARYTVGVGTVGLGAAGEELLPCRSEDTHVQAMSQGPVASHLCSLCSCRCPLLMDKQLSARGPGVGNSWEPQFSGCPVPSV